MSSGRADITRHTVDRLLTPTRHSGFPLPQVSGIMGNARPHPPTLGQSAPRDLARLLRRHPGGFDWGARRRSPVDVDKWQWRCGFYPGSEPGEHRHGTATDFFTGRREFEAAWREFSAKKTEADYQEWRDQRDRTVRKYASWARGEKPPSLSSMMRCACGVRFDSHVLRQNLIHLPHIYAAQAAGLTW